MEFGDLIAALDGWKIDHGYRIVQMTLAPARIVASSDVLENEIAEFDDCSGWIARQSCVCALSPGSRADDPSLGKVVSAEITSGSKSLQIRRIHGGWSITTVVEGEGEAYLYDDLVYTTRAHGGARYRRYHELPDDGAVRLAAWRFVGFEEME